MMPKPFYPVMFATREQAKNHCYELRREGFKNAFTRDNIVYYDPKNKVEAMQ